MPISMFERSANGTSLVTSSQSNTAKLHMSAERRLISSGFFCRAEDQEQGNDLDQNLGLNRQSVLSPKKPLSLEDQDLQKGESTFRCHPCWRVHPAWTLERELHICHAYPGSHVIINLVSWNQNTFIRISKHVFLYPLHYMDCTVGNLTVCDCRFFYSSPWRSCCWDNDVGSWAPACAGMPFHTLYPEQTSQPVSDPQQNLNGKYTQIVRNRHNDCEDE